MPDADFPEPRKASLKSVTDDLDESEEIVSYSAGLPAYSPLQIAQMEVEIPSMPVSIRSTFQTRLAQSKSEVEKVKKSVVSGFTCEKTRADDSVMPVRSRTERSSCLVVDTAAMTHIRMTIRPSRRVPACSLEPSRSRTHRGVWRMRSALLLKRRMWAPESSTRCAASGNSSRTPAITSCRRTAPSTELQVL